MVNAFSRNQIWQSSFCPGEGENVQHEQDLGSVGGCSFDADFGVVRST
jgi:hypothetical protein